MMRSCFHTRTKRSWYVSCPLALLVGVLSAALTIAEPAPPGSCDPDGASGPEQIPSVLNLADAVQWAIKHNPALATLRKQRGIAVAGITIANTYPFNPIVQDFIWGAGGPSAAGITNRVFNEHTTRLDIEYRGQGRHRRAWAQATLSRTDWDIATQEVLTGVQVLRAFNTAVYRREKLRVLEQTARLQEEVAGAITRLVEQGQQPQTELMLARTDVAEALAAVAPARNTLVVAENDLSRLLGVIDTPYTLEGTLEKALPPLDETDLVAEAKRRRPDLHSLEMAVQEAEARVRLEIANRWGNPSVGPAMEYNETSVTFVGMWAIWQIPVLNTRRGDIQQRQAERARAVQAVESLHVTLRQDVLTALRRLRAAEETANVFRTQTIPTLRAARADLDRLFSAGTPGVTLARVIGIRTRLLAAFNNYLDVLLEMSLAEADLAAAIGDPSLALLPPRPAPETETAPAPRKVGQ
jgi:outer membrane protein TolC